MTADALGRFGVSGEQMPRVVIHDTVADKFEVLSGAYELKNIRSFVGAYLKRVRREEREEL